MQAHEYLESALKTMTERAKLRDSEGGERSMAATVQAFNAVRGTNLKEEDGWAFMVLLKLVRSSQGQYHADDYVDGAAYFGLLGEAAEKERGTKKPKKKYATYIEEFLDTQLVFNTIGSSDHYLPTNYLYECFQAWLRINNFPSFVNIDEFKKALINRQPPVRYAKDPFTTWNALPKMHKVSPTIVNGEPF